MNKTDRWLVAAFNNKMLVNGEEWENRGETTSGQVPLQYIAPHSVDYTLLKGTISSFSNPDLTSAEDIQEITGYTCGSYTNGNCQTVTSPSGSTGDGCHAWKLTCSKF